LVNLRSIIQRSILRHNLRYLVYFQFYMIISKLRLQCLKKCMVLLIIVVSKFLLAISLRNLRLEVDGVVQS
jgi:hypothetical protein